jgi:hypothetical protein
MKSLVVALLLPASVAWAEDNGALVGLQEENRQLRERLDKLENELSQIKRQLAAPPAAVLTGEQVARLQTLADSKKKPVLAGLDFEIYGYIKLDAAYDDSRTSVGNYGRWVESEGVRRDDDQFSMTVNQTRLGLNITGPTLHGLKTSGKVEIDFYGAGAAENKPEPLLRHAYLNAEWLDYHFSVLAGQTSDIISPLGMPTLNYTVGWWQGNIGYRRPQIRLTEDLPLGGSWRLKLEAGPTRTITDRKFFFTASTDPASGDDAGFPTMQGRASLGFPVGGGRTGTIGVSGHWGQEEQHVAAASGDREIRTWSANADVRVPVTKWLLLQGEAFIGENLDMYLGGIGQGFNTNTFQTVKSRGVWAAATFDPHPKWQFNLGGGIDDPDDEELPANGRTYNSVIFVNGTYFFTANFSMGLEAAYLHTGYKGQADGDDWREQLSFIYKF